MPGRALSDSPSASDVGIGGHPEGHGGHDEPFEDPFVLPHMPGDDLPPGEHPHEPLPPQQEDEDLHLIDHGVPAEDGDKSRDATDSGGDSCSWYEAPARQELCGCCDHETFVADHMCTACSQVGRFTNNNDNGELEQWLARFPRKTTRIGCYDCGLFGALPRTLAERFPALKHIELKHNRLSGPIPPELWGLPELEVVDLAHNAFSGEITEELGNAKKLTHLHLDGNILSGRLPHAVGRLTALRVLQLQGNRLSGVLPEEVGAWRELQSLDLSENSFEGPLPVAVGNWSEVTQVRIVGNGLSGPLPKAVGAWQKAEAVKLGGNRFSGAMPAEVGAWHAAMDIQLDGNMFTGPLPRAVEGWRSLVSLSLKRNRLTGSLPQEVGSWRHLKHVFLQENLFEGPVPRTVGNWTVVQSVNLAGNLLAGALPTEVGLWGGTVASVNISDNQLSGEVPASVGKWVDVSSISLARNNFSGTPPKALGLLSALVHLDLSGNGFEGLLPDLAGAKSLEELNVSGNSLTGLGSLPVRLRKVDLSSCRLRQLPEALLQNLPLVELLLEGNLIDQWPPRAGRALLVEGCGDRRFMWPQLRKLDASGNPLGEPQSFLGSLSHLEGLEVLSCRACGFSGALSQACSANASSGFLSLTELDLSENALEAVLAPPPARLGYADFSGNDLEVLHSEWYNVAGRNGIRTLRLQRNPRLRVEVAWPEVPCRSHGMPVLTADPAAYVDAEGGISCTRLCPGVLTSYSTDHTLNSSSLCRCKAGHMGFGQGCRGCELNTYSRLLGTGGVRECRACPAHSKTNGTLADGIGDCKCAAGTYLDSSKEQCKFCSQHPFRATRTSGQEHEEACGCNTSYSGLKESGGICGCDDGLHMNHVAKSCQRCSHAETCMWGTLINESIYPPKVKRGYWAEPVGELEKFAKNSIWRCTSKFSCLQNGTCAPGRTGIACGLCLPRMYGSPSGPCQPCPEGISPQLQCLLIVVVALALVPLPMLLHHALEAKQGSLQVLLQLRAVRGSLKQMVKHVQTVSVIGKFSVSWPPLAQAFFDLLASLTLNVPSLSAIACTSSQTSAGLEMGAKWALPLAFVAMTFLAIPLSWALQHVAKRRCPKRMATGEALCMGHWDAARVLLFTTYLFWSTLAANAMEVLTCEPSPNGCFTVRSYPHVTCSLKNGEFLALTMLALLALLLYVVLPLWLVQHGLAAASERLVESELCDRGWYAFLLDDFRDGHLFWAMRIMMKDMLLVLIPAVMPGWGAAQLLSTAVLMAVHTVLVMRSKPYLDQSNTLLETWNGVTAATLCVYSVGMGYQQTLGMEEVEELFQDGAEDPLYRGRAVGMVVVQVISIAVPAVVLAFQLLCALPFTSRFVPKRLKPMTPEQMGDWVTSFLERASDLESLAVVLRAFDDTDISDFRTIFENTPATIGHALSETSTSHFVRRVSSRKSSRISQATAQNFQSEFSFGGRSEVSFGKEPSVTLLGSRSLTASGTPDGVSLRRPAEEAWDTVSSTAWSQAGCSSRQATKETARSSTMGSSLAVAV